MLYTTHLLPSGYFHTKNEMIAVNIVEAIEWTRIRLHMDRWIDGRMDKVKPIPGRVLPLCWVIWMCRHFDPLFLTFWGLILIRLHQNDLLGYQNYHSLQKSIFLAPNSIFPSIFLGPIFSRQRHNPISFRTEYPPPPPPGNLYTPQKTMLCWGTIFNSLRPGDAYKIYVNEMDNHWVRQWLVIYFLFAA